ncbi:MAG: hypothetical protein K0B16_07035 [Burkholderiaceae bacterium]|nr:hypothetical protein [Burkholderiaceae bacterium]
MNYQRPVALAVVVAFAAAGCATSSQDIAATYTSPLQYQNLDCDQLAAENQRIYTRVSSLGGRLDEAAKNDKTITGVGIILFWPALFALGGTKTQEAEYARLKGEHDAVKQAAIQKKCPAMVAGQTVSLATTESSAPTVAGAVTAAGSDASAAPERAHAGIFAVGDRLVYQNYDSVSKAVTGTQSLTVTRIANGKVEYNDGALTTDAAGNWLAGKAAAIKFIGIFKPSYSDIGTWRGRFESGSDRDQYAEVEVRALGPASFSAEGVTLTAMRLQVSGFTSVVLVGSGAGYGSYSLDGELLVDPASGVLLAANLQSRHRTLGASWKLVKRVAPR